MRSYSTGLLDSTNRNSRPPVTACKTNFTLDRGKQVKKLFKDTFATNYEIEVNSNDENVNVQCNLGFYSTVAKPVMEQLSFGPSPCINDVTVRCHDITQRTDQGGAATTTVIIFRMHKHNLSIGQVTVHMHHTARKVQIQGSALMPPDNTKAPVWFVQQVLKERFNDLSKSQASDINKLNQTVGALVSRQSGTDSTMCAGCKASFNGRSSPEQCPQCNLFYHKFKCFPTDKHPCQLSKRKTPSTAGTLKYPPPFSGACSTPGLCSKSADPSHRAAVVHTTQPSQVPLANVTTSSCGPKTSSPTQPIVPPSSSYSHPPRVSGMLSFVQTPEAAAVTLQNPVIPVSQQAPSTSSTTQSSQIPNTSIVEVPSSQTGLDPTALPFVSQQHPKQPMAQGKGKQKSKTDKSGADCALEYARYEVNITKAIISDQEATIKDLKFKNGILEARVAELEKKQKQDIYDRYFPLPGADDAAQQSSSQQKPSSCCSNATHFALPVCIGQHNHQPSSGGTSSSDGTAMKDISSAIADLTTHLDNLKYRLDILVDVSIPKMIRDALQNPAQVLQTESDNGQHLSSHGPPHVPDSVAQSQGVTVPQESNNISCTSMDEAALDNSNDLN